MLAKVVSFCLLLKCFSSLLTNDVNPWEQSDIGLHYLLPFKDLLPSGRDYPLNDFSSDVALAVTVTNSRPKFEQSRLCPYCSVLS